MSEGTQRARWSKVVSLLKFLAITSTTAVLCTAYFAVPNNTESFWQGARQCCGWLSGFIIEKTHSRTSTMPTTAANPPEIVPAMPPLPPADDSANSPDRPYTVASDDCSASPPDPSNDPKSKVLLPLFMEPPLPPFDPDATARMLKKRRSKHGKPIRFEKIKIAGIPIYKTVIDLDDPETYITVGLANNAREANSSVQTHGDESFDSFIKRYHGAFLANGTFFSKDEQKRVMGNMVCEGEFRKYSQWENYGTTLGIKADNELEMVTARLEGRPPWEDYWFSITCGPRLLKNGEVLVVPEQEGFTDSHVLTVGPRAALGFNSKKRQLIHAAFLRGLSLQEEAKMMKSLGCDEAMNLDGGASRALAHEGAVIVKAGRPLTNVLVVYDAKCKAPSNVIASWERFQEGERPKIP
jgi:hypothetical protein